MTQTLVIILILVAIGAIFVGEKFTKSGGGKDHKGDKKGGDKGKH